MREAKLIQGYLKQFNKKKTKEGCIPWFFNYEIKAEGYITGTGDHAVVSSDNLVKLLDAPERVLPHLTLSGTYLFFKGWEGSKMIAIDDQTRKDVIKELVSWIFTKGQADKVCFNKETITTEERTLTCYTK